MGSKTDFAEDATLNSFLRNTSYTPAATVYLAMLTADPTDTGSLANEVSGGSYARQAVAFDAPSPAGQTQNTAKLTFPTATASWGTVSHWGVMDALSGGNMLYHGAWTTPIAVGIGVIPEVAIGELEIDED